MNVMALGLRAIRVIASTDLADRIPLDKILYRSSKEGFRAVSTAGRTFTAATRLGRPARLKTASPIGLFDLRPDDEQSMLFEAFSDFGRSKLRPAALRADEECRAPDGLLAESAELGLTMLGVPEELGGAVSERSAVTTVLAAEALAHGDMGLAVAALTPSGVATALSLWGDEDQQATYLPAFVGEDVPAAALAILEPQALFDPFALETTAVEDGGDYVLSGVKALVPRAAEAELLLVAARIRGGRHGLFLVEGGSVLTRPAPAMGIRAAATGEVLLEDVRVPAGALLAGGDPAVYAECVRRARLAWCAVTCGTARAVLDYLIPYVKERKAFGEPIAYRQAVAFNVADVAIEAEGMRLATLRAAARADAGKGFAREVAVARRLCSEYGAKIGSDGVGLLGGHGYIKEHPVERWYRDLRATGVMEGALLA